MKILFLDIDGVCNNHSQMLNLYCGIHKDKIELLNQIISRTGCKIVISSAWRYMVHGGEMTLRGFEYMLITHGLKCQLGTIIGVTPTDETVTTRGHQIIDWLKQNNCVDNQYVVVDDLELDIKAWGHPLVQTDGKVGLTQVETDLIIEKLLGYDEV